MKAVPGSQVTNSHSHRSRSASARGRVPAVYCAVRNLLTALAVVLLCAAGVSLHAQTANFSGVTSNIDTTDFTAPEGAAFDASGNLYVLDGGSGDGTASPGNGAIWKFANNGIGSYGAGTQFLAPGSFIFPVNIVVDPSGNLWVADYGCTAVCTTNGQVYKVAGGVVTPIGTGWVHPVGIASDSSGNIFVTDRSSNTVSEITGSTVTVLNTNVVNSPFDLTVDAAGNLYVIDGNLNQIVEEAAPGYTTATPVGPILGGPLSIKFDENGNLWVSESGGGDVREIFAPGFTTSKFWGGFNEPVAALPDGHGNLVVSDHNQRAIRLLATGAVNLGTVALGATSGNQTLSFTFAGGGSTTIQAPKVVTGNATVSDFTDAGTGTCTTLTGNPYASNSTCTVTVNFSPKAPGLRRGAVELLDSGGNLLAEAFLYGIGTGPQIVFNPGKTVAPTGGFSYPQSVAVDAAGDIFVADAALPAVVRFPVGGSGAAIGTGFTFTNPDAVAVDGAGNVFVADSGSGQVDEIFNTGGYTNVKTLATALTSPNGIAVDANDNVFVAEGGGTHAVIELKAANNYAVVTTLSTAFTTPAGVAVDASGNVFVADNGSTSITELVAVNGQVPVSPTTQTYGSFQSPTDVAIDPDGNLYVSDDGAGTITKLTAISGYATGSAQTLASSLTAPGSVAAGANGNVYFITNGTDNKLYQLDFADAPTLTFNSSTYQTVSTDSPKSVTLTNIGSGAGSDLDLTALTVSTTTVNAANSFAQVPGSGTFPDCTATSALTSGTTCDLSISFTPQYAEAIAGTAIATDNSLSVPGSSQTIALNGTGTKADVTLNWSNPAAITYGTTLAGVLNATATNGANTVAGNFSYTEQVGAGTPSAVTASTVLAPGTYTLTANFTPTDTNNYNTPAAIQVTLVVGKAALTVTANDASRAYGVANPTFGATITGFVNGDTQASSVTGSPSLTTTATISSPAGAYTITAAAGTLASTNYSFTFVNGTLTIGKATLTVTANDATRAYGAANPTFGATITGFLNGDTQASSVTGTPSLTTTATSASPVGTYTITAAAGTLASTNYSFTFVNGTLTVSKASLTVTANDATRAYGAANPTFGATITGFVNGDTQATAVTGAPSLTTTATSASPVGTYTITAAAGTLASTNYSFTFVNGTLTVSKAALTVTANSVTRAYGAANPTFGATITGFVNGDTQATAVTGTPSLTTTATAASPVGSYTITAAAGTLASTNYSFTFVNGTLTVSKVTLTVTAVNATRAYGAANPAFSATMTGFVNGDTQATAVTGAPSLTTTATAASPVGTYTITAAAGTLASANYSFTFVNGTLTISQATLTVTANNATRAYGAANPTFGATITGFLNGDTQATAVTGAPSLTTTATATSPAGTYTITAAAGTLASTNYSFTFVNGTLTISQATLTVTANNATRAYGAANPTFAATITGFVNGDTQASSVTGTPSLTTTATAASPAGTYAITAAAGTLASPNYSFTFVNGTLTVSKATLTVTVNNASRVYGAANPAFSGTVTGLVNGDTVTTTYSTTATVTSAVGTYPITATVTGAAAANYTPAVTNGTLTITKAPLTVTVNNATRVYGAANPTFTGTITGLLNGDTVTATYSTTATATSPVGTYPITATISGAAAGNYTPTVTAGTLTITQASTTITWAAPASIAYGTALSGTQLNATANVAGAFVYTPPAGTVLPVGSNQTLSVTFTPTDTTDYKSSTATTTITVTGGSLVVSANNATRVYGAANPTFTGTVTGQVNGDTFTESFTTTATATSSVGTYAIVPSATGTNLSFYTVVTHNGALTITRADTTTVLAADSSSVNPGATVTLTATVASATTGTPTGSVSFYDGTTLLGTGTLSGGAATFATSTLAAGSSHVLTAVYSGDTNFNTSSTTSSTTIAVGALDFTLGAPTPSTQSGAAGTAFTYTFSVSPTYAAYADTVNFTVAGLPAGGSATFSPASIPANGGAQTVTMIVTTSANSAALIHPEKAGRGFIPVALAFFFLPLAGTKRMRRQGRWLGRMACLLLLLLGGLGATTALTGCGSHSGSFTSSQSYTITITATSGSIQHTATVNLDLTK